jgi:hypothetical protein
MTQLATLFSALSLIFYLKARVAESKGKFSTFSICAVLGGVSAIFAILSKENAAILPFLILIIERFLKDCLVWKSSMLKRAASGILVFTSLFILGFLVLKAVNYGFFEQYNRRDFSPFERLLTQPSVVLFYLKELYLPSLYTPGLYYDFWPIARSASDAAVSVVILAFIVTFSIWLYAKRYLTGLALALFFCGHLIESTVINLEMVFEHRNYLPSFLLGLLFVDLYSAISAKKIYRVLVLIVPLALMAGITYERAGLWENRIEHALYMTSANPGSIRAQIELNNALMSRGLTDQAAVYLDRGMEANPENLYLRLHDVILRCQLGIDTNESAQRMVDLADTAPYDGRRGLGYQKLLEFLYNGTCSELSPRFIDQLFRAHLRDDLIAQTDRGSREGLYAMAGKFYALYPQYTEVPLNIDDSIWANPEYMMAIAASLANDGHFDEALLRSEQASSKLHEQSQVSDREQALLKNIENFQKTVRADLEKSGR